MSVLGSNNGLVPSGSKPLPETMMTNFLDVIYGLHRTAWVNSLRPSDPYIWVSTLTIIVSDNGLPPSRCQAIIWPNAGILLIGPLGTNFSEILIEIHTFSFKKMHLEMLSGKWRPSCLSFNVLTEFHQTPISLKSSLNNSTSDVQPNLASSQVTALTFFIRICYRKKYYHWWHQIKNVINSR